MRPQILALAAALAFPLAASAHNWSYAFAWANAESSPSYTPDALYSYSDTGRPPRIERSQTGKYTVRFPGMSGIHALEANVQVTAYGTTSDYCKAGAWAGDTITVLCFDATGDVVDTLFSVLYLEQDLVDHTSLTPPDLGPTDVGRYGFALADQPANPSYAPDPSYASNPAGGAITATRTGTGAYTITFTGMSAIGAGGGHAQVTAFGPGTARCRVRSWGSENVNVRCFDASGAPADSAYSVLYWRTDAGDPGVAYAWANLPTTASYTPHASYSFNASGGTLTASRTSTGSYGMLWDGMGGIGVNGGNIQVTAYDSGSADVRCKVASWSGTNAFVRCFDTAGNPVDSAYTVLFLKTPKKPWAREYAFAHAALPSDPSYHPYSGTAHNPVAGHDFGATHFDPRTDIEITRSGTGNYGVAFNGYRAYPGGGNVQVGSTESARYCKVASWDWEAVDVRCFDASGSPGDAGFFVFYLKAPAENTSVAYAWAGNASLASYTPEPAYSHNPTGAPITATRTGPGSYTMTWSGFGGLAAGGGHPQVTSYGASNRRCQIQSWGGDQVRVRCFDGAGNPADSAYSILYLRPAPEDDGLAFAWADQPTAPTNPYTPNTLYSFNGGNDVSAWNHGVGDESVLFDQFAWRGLNAGTALVSGFGLSDNRCHFFSGGPEVLHVACLDAAGNPIDAFFNGLRVKPVAVPEPGHVALLSSGAALLAMLARRRGVQPR